MSEKSISSLKVKYEIPSLLELTKEQTSELASKPSFRVIAFYPNFFNMTLGYHNTLFKVHDYLH